MTMALSSPPLYCPYLGQVSPEGGARSPLGGSDGLSSNFFHLDVFESLQCSFKKMRRIFALFCPMEKLASFRSISAIASITYLILVGEVFV